MGAIADLIKSLDGGDFEAALNKAMDGADKAALQKLAQEMEGQAGGIPDQTKRHLFKNGIASVKMMADSL